MLVIANNLSFANREFVRAAKDSDKLTMSTMAEVIKKAGADAINVSLSLDGDGDEKYMAAAVGAVGRAGLPVYIDTRSPEAMAAGISSAKVPVTLNYMNAEPSMADVMDRVASIAADNKTDLVLYAVKAGTPADTDERLALISELIEKANGAGIPNERLIVDPVILHLGGGGTGQQHAVAVQRTLYGLRELVEPNVRTTCWISNASAGAPAKLRAVINDTYLAMLAGAGLDSAYLDVFNKETMRTVRLIRAINNETVYSTSDAEL
jgi:5-methyltetrahydrofolate corrinoid/iron sulfur protein methyltransferase